MPRKIIYKSSECAYHLVGRTNNKEWFPIPISECWHLYSHYILKLQENYSVLVHGFVLMSNHFHFLCSTPESNVDKAMHYFMTQTSKGIGFAGNKMNHLYGKRYHWTSIHDSLHYASTLKYIYRNPLRANICSNVKEYPWSSLTYPNLKFQLNEFFLDEHIPYNNLQDWINEKGNFDENIIKKVLSKTTFKAPKDRVSRKLIDLKKYIITKK